MTAQIADKPLMLEKRYLQGMIEATVGQRVALMVPGDREWRRCFEYRAEGVISEIVPPQHGPREVRVRLDERHEWAGDFITVYASDVTVLD